MTSFLLVLALVLPIHAQAPVQPGEEFMRAEVLEIIWEHPEEFAGMERIVQKAEVRIVSGPDEGYAFILENGILNGRDDMRLFEGETIVVRKLTKADGSILYLQSEKYRLPGILWLGAFFLALTFLLGGWTGLRSLAGLVVSVLILTFYVVPMIAKGSNPLVTSLIGAFVIACTSLYLAHGFHRRTSVALLSTLVTLAIAAALSVVFVSVAKLFGMGTEESMFLQLGIETINLRGLLLGGMIIGCLGVLDDVTTAQTAAVDEIRKANPSMPEARLLQAGFSVGREHIASLINTLALAYAGASLPLLLLFQVNEGYPLWMTLNSEFLAEEIIRTLVGSTALLVAVPISTILAAKLLRGSSGPSGMHSHAHRL